MPEPLILLVALLAAGVVVLRPLWSPWPGDEAADDSDADALRYRVALESLRDVEADRRAGSLDDGAYTEQLAQAEARAAAARRALERPSVAEERGAPTPGRQPAIVAAALIAALTLVGAVVPATGVANRTDVNEALVAAQESESTRQERIRQLQSALAEDPDDTATLSSLADAHLAGSSQDDLVRAAVALQLLIRLEPERADAYERIMTAYLRAGDHANARAAHDSYVELDAADPVEAAFFDGIIALRGEDDPQRALEAFDRFLELAPDDPRSEMIRGLREEAAADV